MTNDTMATVEAAATDRGREPRQRERPAALFADEQANTFRQRWTTVQAGFVDEPRTAVQQADSLVSDVLKQLSDAFANERATLEQQWNRGNDVTTEDLRITLQRYHSFFDRLLSLE